MIRKMDDKKIQRINELACKAKAQGLTEAEKSEQEILRKEYIAAYRASLRSQLENTYIVDADGKEHKLKKKND